ncbi:MAG: hypothetical protein RBQ91_05905 [Acholeplasma sp.]|nr:hypothetical protein [Acholeplasma sp.]
MIRITEIKIDVRKVTDKASEQVVLKTFIRQKYMIFETDILSFSIYKKAVDARKKEAVFFVYSLDLTLKDEERILKKNHPNCQKAIKQQFLPVVTGKAVLKHRPVIVGFGPSGIFSALLLSRMGYRPIVLERGLDVDQRTQAVDQFWRDGNFNESSTILFGEGGAGTFSDGKLTTLINDLRCHYVLEALHKHGADEEILYMSKPHVGTDVLKGIIKNIRKEIIDLGGEVRFSSKVTDFIIEDNKLKGVVINDKESLMTEVLLLGIGHSARETFETLYEKGFNIVQKAFSVGVRIEHPQSMINESQYGVFKDYLRPAEYKLSYQSPNGRGAYTFCMCPGGYVMCASSETEGLVTNGMSESKRDGDNANSALLVNIMPEDFNSTHPLAGMYFQRAIEQKAFQAAGSNYYAPIQRVEDFLSNRKSVKVGSVKPTYLPGFTFCNLHEILPTFVSKTLKEAIIHFDKKIKGFMMPDALLTGVETRSSSPIRLLRNDEGLSNIKGVYPMGEGAGYAGGIMSSAVDGLKTVEKLIEKFNKLT